MGSAVPGMLHQLILVLLLTASFIDACPGCIGGCPCEASFKPEDCQRMKEEKKRQRSHCKLPGCPPAGCPVATGKCPSMTFFDYSLPGAGAVEEVMGGLVRPLSRAEMAAPLPLQRQTFMRAQGGCIHS